MNKDEWIRHFRKARGPETLERMLSRSLSHSPREAAVINQAADHRLTELETGRLLEIDC